MNFDISIDIGPIPTHGLSKDVFPSLAAAVASVTHIAHRQWRAYASGAPLPDGSTIGSRSGTYLRSIQQRMLSDFSGEVFSDSPYAGVIEQGTPARDMKRMLYTSMKVRVSKTGKRYLIIPFRWGTPGTNNRSGNVMSAELGAAARQLAPSRVTGQGRRVSGTGAYDIHTRKLITVRQRRYRWGGRLDEQAMRAHDVVGRELRHAAGMVKFQSATRAGSRDTQYLTFRVMTEDSTGWLAPARPGKRPARSTAKNIQPIAKKAFAAAIEADIAAILSG